MQGRGRGQRDLLDVESVAGHLLVPGSVFAFLAQHRSRLFPAEMFEDLFPSRRGRPSIAPDVVASVIVLQTLHGLSDREAAESGHVRLAVEGGVRCRGRRRFVPPVHVDVLAGPAGGQQAAASDL